MPRNAAKEGAWEFRLASLQALPSLAGHLLEQIALENMEPVERIIAEHIVDTLDENGYVAQPWEKSLGQITALTESKPETVESVLARVQGLDPAGVAARGLSECLELQLKQLPDDTPGVETALAIIPAHMDLLASRNYPTLCKITGLDEDAVGSASALIRKIGRASCRR